ncbi:MAG: radical SAM protein [Syntrophales bacterium]|nr:radical SAM protein [Syntrophales bacterium]
MNILPAHLRIVAWEITRRCNLNCIHCRAASHIKAYEGELSTTECLKIIEQMAMLGTSIVILTGGEPLLRPDFKDIATYGTEMGLRMVLATNGTMLTEEIVYQMKEAGISRVSVSLDGPDAEFHDRFRQVEGAFAGAIRGIELLKEMHMEFQINTTITFQNFRLMEKIHDLAVDLGAQAHHIFLLVPVGRAKSMEVENISPEAYERALIWFADHAKECPIELKATCAPHYYRIYREKGFKSPEMMTRGCLGGISFCFISHTGIVQPCGYLEINCGNVTKESLVNIWEQSEIFLKLRNLRGYKGKCGSCEFIKICGGCRARAFEATGDFLAEEPLCTYKPKRAPCI